MAETSDRQDSTDGRIERAKDAALGAHDSHPSHLDEAGEGIGGIAGALWGAEWGSAAGPLGALLGGIVGALGGWWTGRAVTEAASTLTQDDDWHFRSHFDALPNKPADRAYDDVRGAYFLGKIAAHHPDFIESEFEEIEPELARGWAGDAEKYGAWTTVRPYAAAGFARGRSRLDETARRARARQEARTPGELEDRRR